MSRHTHRPRGGPDLSGNGQQLASLIKSARDIMRKDKGLSGELDRLPMLTWILFLKFLDDTEAIRQEEAARTGAVYHPAIEPPYRWRDWAADRSLTGNPLLDFLHQERTVRPDGTRGPGLFTYLRSLRSADGQDRRDVIASVFRGVTNRMVNGDLLRSVVDKVGSIHFHSSTEIHALSRLYESMLREMRDAAGDSGEFYTPRAVVRFMVEVTAPRLGETVLDPACGTGGFLVEAFAHLQPQCRTAADERVLQERSIFGQEAKPLPYLLCQMNLLLHGLSYPQITYGNSLAAPLESIADEDRVHVILTNPPFGGEEEPGILKNFPEDLRNSETALLFLQLIMRKLRPDGRAAMVVPDGMLFGNKVSARIKHALLRQFNLHTIVRLPRGVFLPYTAISANLLFFDSSGPTREIWYYEQPLPQGRRYTKTRPIQDSDLADCRAWWSQRVENERAWRVPVSDVVVTDEQGHLSVNLDVKNPHRREPEPEQRPPRAVLADLIGKEMKIVSLLHELAPLLDPGP